MDSQNQQDCPSQDQGQHLEIKISSSKSFKRYGSSVFKSPENSRSKISKFYVPQESSVKVNLLSKSTNKFDSLNMVDFSENRKDYYNSKKHKGKVSDTLKNTGFLIKRKGSCGELTELRMQPRTLQSTPKRDNKKRLKFFGSSNVGVSAQIKAVVGAKGLLRRTRKKQQAIKSTWNFIMKKDTDENEY